MSAVNLYLKKLFLDDKVNFMDEDVSVWLKEVGPKMLIKKVDNLVKSKDVEGLTKFFKSVPKVDFKQIYTRALTIDNNFENKFKTVKSMLAKKVKFLKGNALDSAAFVLSVTITDNTNIKRDSAKVVSTFSNKLNQANVKNFVGASIGMFGLILAGMLVVASFSALTMGPLLFALAIVGVSLIFIMARG